MGIYPSEIDASLKEEAKISKQPFPFSVTKSV